MLFINKQKQKNKLEIKVRTGLDRPKIDDPTSFREFITRKFFEQKKNVDVVDGFMKKKNQVTGPYDVCLSNEKPREYEIISFQGSVKPCVCWSRTSLFLCVCVHDFAR